jgi:hypothetical protein
MDYSNPHQVQKVPHKVFDMVSGLIHPVFFCESLLIDPSVAYHYSLCALLYLVHPVVVPLDSLVVVVACVDLLGEVAHHQDRLVTETTSMVQMAHHSSGTNDKEKTGHLADKTLLSLLVVLEIFVSVKVLSHQVVRLLLIGLLLLLCISFYAIFLLKFLYLSGISTFRKTFICRKNMD